MYAIRSYSGRLSIAEVKPDGPYSCFEGYHRNISVLTGEGMTLTVDGVSSGLLKPFEAFPFSGEAKTTCTLTDGKIDDFNVIYDPAFVKATVQWVDPVQAMEIVLPPNSTVFVIAGKGEATVRIDASSFNLDCWDVVQINLDHEPIEFALPGQPATKVGIVVIQAL